jgi:hypothetical protein
MKLALVALIAILFNTQLISAANGMFFIPWLLKISKLFFG